MPVLIAIAGFLGAWLLVAGPLMQAWLELRDEQLDEKRYAAIDKTVPPPEHISAWWWLVPPVAWWKTHRRNDARQKAVVEAMRAVDPALIEESVSLINKANGWFIVAGGAALIGVKETWELVESLEWPVWLFWILVVIAPLLCVANLVARVRVAERLRNGNVSSPSTPAAT